MKITYDEEADAIAVILREGTTVEDSADVEDGVTVWLDGSGHIVGLEVLDASERMGADPLAEVAIQRFARNGKSTKK